MRALMGLIKDRHGTYYAQKRVPDRLQAVVARVLKSARPRQVFLKKSLGTKVLKEANSRAKPVLMAFDRTLADAEALLKTPEEARPLRVSLNDAEIKRMAEYVYASELAFDERLRYGRDEAKRAEAEHIRLEGRPFGPWYYPYETLPAHGLSPAQLADYREQLAEDLKHSREALALGDISVVQDHIAIALSVFGINLDQKSPSYPKLGIEVLRAYVRALQDIERRNAGDPVSTPAVALTFRSIASGGLREAFEGWNKERERPNGTVHEYGRAIDMFIQLHGDLPLLEIKRSHARSFREALQLVPKVRKGTLLKATLPELSEYGRKHPEVTRVSPGMYYRAIQSFRRFTRQGNEEALRLARQAISLDASFAAAYGVALACYTQRNDENWIKDDDVAEGKQYAMRAIEVGADDAFALARAAHFFSTVLRDAETADVIADQAIAVNPNLAEARRIRGWASSFLGQHERAIEQFDYALRLNPLDPQVYYVEGGLARANFLLRRFEVALSWATKSLARQKNYVPGQRYAMVSYAMLGRIAEAQMMLARMHEAGKIPVSLSQARKRIAYWQQEDIELYIEAHRIAGMPE